MLTRLEIISVGVDYSVAETKGTAVVDGGSQACPAGAWHCALLVTPIFVAVTGEARATAIRRNRTAFRFPNSMRQAVSLAQYPLALLLVLTFDHRRRTRG